ncbi:MAG: NTP/NDP exchange transporter [Chlamydiae bacterium]|nr:NTP/NDP exchange transporter [Chlamydiota bacterium]
MEVCKEPHSFSKWRQRLWPIHSSELKKLLPLILMKFFISLVYSVLTCMKDTLVVTTSGSGAEVIPVLKGWIVLPCAILATVFYSKLSNVFKRSTLFYGTIGSLLGVLVLYAFVLYPNAALLQPDASADWLLHKLGHQYGHWVAVYRYWIHSLFFVTAELWATLVIFLLFWGFTNHVTSITEAKRTYTILIAAGDIATIMAGPLILVYAKKYAHLDFLFTMQWMIGYVLVFGGSIIGLYYYMTSYVLKDKRFTLPSYLQREGEKTKLSLLEGLKHIASSRYLLALAMLVIGCSLSINLIEVTWKAHLKLLYPHSADYQAFFGKVTSYVGFIGLITVLFIGGGFLRHFGWHFCAQLTPIVMGVTGLTFFSFVLFNNHAHFGKTIFGIPPLIFLVFLGAFQNISSKVMKYSFFDPTKEMAFIPLDPESKTKGKAAIDVVGSRFGKSGSAWIQVGLIDLAGTGSILSVTHLLTPIVMIVIIGWILATRYINKEFSKKQAELTF